MIGFYDLSDHSERITHKLLPKHREIYILGELYESNYHSSITRWATESLSSLLGSRTEGPGYTSLHELEEGLIHATVGASLSRRTSFGSDQDFFPTRI
jgi:hypothetical protein